VAGDGYDVLTEIGLSRYYVEAVVGFA